MPQTLHGDDDVDLPDRPVSARLAVAVALVPQIFSWATLRKGHSTKARAAAFGYAVIHLVAATAVVLALASASTERERVAEQERSERSAIVRDSMRVTQLGLAESTGPVRPPSTASGPADERRIVEIDAGDVAASGAGDAERWKDSILQVSGVVVDVAPDPGSPHVTMRGSFGGVVAATFASGRDEDLAGMAPGAAIVLRCGGMVRITAPILTDCVR